MDDTLRRLFQLFEPRIDNVVNVVDILVVAYLNFRIISLIRTTRAWRVLGGIVIFVLALFLSNMLGLKTLNYILDRATLLAPVALVILLLPELRQTLEGFAKLGLWPERLPGDEHPTEAQTVEEIVAAVAEMAALRVGALIVIERGVHLNDIALNGVQLNAQVSAPLLGSIFYHGNPLHDGAVVIRGDTIVAAACRLPLSENNRLAQNIHMRHRAGVGISEQTDCVCVIVSEERGAISLAMEGALTPLADHIELREALNREIRGVAKGARKTKGRKRKNRAEGADE